MILVHVWQLRCHTDLSDSYIFNKDNLQYVTNLQGDQKQMHKVCHVI